MPHPSGRTLAILGGPPAFQEPLVVGRPNIGDTSSFFGRLDDILRRRILTNGGPYVEAFEERVRQVTGARHAIAVANATLGLQLVAVALGLTGEVILPAFTFIATPHAFLGCGLRPVFADVDPITANLDPDCAESLITPATSAIVGVHLWGRPCAPEHFSAIAAKHRIALIFDSAHAFACSHRGQMMGQFGNAEVFSFHATKFVNGFEGGAITTNDDELARRLSSMRSFGFVAEDRTEGWGTNAKMSEPSAAMALTTFDSQRHIIATNRDNESHYARGLAGLPGIRLWRHDRSEARNYQHIVISIDSSIAGFDRDTLKQTLIAEGVHARKYFAPGCHRMEPYLSMASGHPPTLPHTERHASEVLSLPTGTTVSPSDIATICDIIRSASALGRHLAQIVNADA